MGSQFAFSSTIFFSSEPSFRTLLQVRASSRAVAETASVSGAAGRELRTYSCTLRPARRTIWRTR